MSGTASLPAEHFDHALDLRAGVFRRAREQIGVDGSDTGLARGHDGRERILVKRTVRVPVDGWKR